MSMCPVCNGLNSLEVECPSCQNQMNDNGRLLDYFDDYSAYLDIEGMKLIDGIADDQKNQQCPHVYYCLNCEAEKTVLIDEI